MSATADRRKETKDHKPRLGTWVACSIVAVVVGVGLCAFTVGYSISFRRDIDRVATTGIQTTGTVLYVDGGGAQGDSEVCAEVQIEGSLSPECITIADPSHLDAGRVIAVRYDPRNPDHEILVGDLPEPLTANVHALFATMFLALALLALAHNLDRRIEAGGGAGSRSGWITLMAPVGLTTWIGFLYVGWRGRRPRWLIWSAVYLIGMVTAVALDPYGDPAQHPGNLGVVLLAAVWLGGMVHSLILRPDVSRAIALVSERHKPVGLPPPPASVVDEPAVPHGPYEGGAELPWRGGDGAAVVELPGPAVVLHALDAEGGAQCGSVRGMLLPTFRRWSSRRLDSFERCPNCLEIAPTRSGRGADAGVVAHEPRWVYRNGWRLAAAALGGYGLFVAWWLVPLQVAAFEPGGVGSVTLGVAVLVSTTIVSLVILWRMVRMHTTIDRDGVRVAGFRPARSIPWSDIRAFRGEGSRVEVARRDGRASHLCGLGPLLAVGQPGLSRASFLNRALGFDGRLEGESLMSLVELGPTSAPDGVLLHAESPSTGAVCRTATGRLVPTFEAWSGGRSGRAPICPICADRVRPRPARRRFPSPPPPYRLPRAAGAKWVYADRQFEGATGWIGLLFGLVFWPPIFRARTVVSGEGITFTRSSGVGTQTCAWGHVRGFETTGTANHTRLAVVTRHNERLRVPYPRPRAGYAEALNHAFGLDEL